MIQRLEAIERLTLKLNDGLAAQARRLAELANQLWQVQAGAYMQFQAPLEVRYAITGGSGIAARSGTTLGSATVTFYTRSGATLTSTSNTATAYNGSTTAVGASKVIMVAGREGGPWDVIMESC